MIKIFKYTLGPGTGRVACLMPHSPQIMSIQVLHNRITIWAAVEEANTLVEQVFYVLETGDVLAEAFMAGRKFLGTFQLNGGSDVFHIFQ